MAERVRLIGITTYVEPAAWGAWQLEAALVPYDYVRCCRAGRRAARYSIPPVADGVDEMLDAVDGLIFSGGNDIDPGLLRRWTASRRRTASSRRATAAEMALLTAALERDVPVLAICRGSRC